MKLLHFDDYRLGVLHGEAVVDVTELVAPRIPHADRRELMPKLIARFDEFRPALQQAASSGPNLPLARVQPRAPLPRPGNIVCMAVNYMEDGTRSAPAPLNAFHKAPTAVIGPDETMVLPDVPATIFEGEAELAVVIGRRAANVARARAMEHVFGYVNFIDGSARGLPPPGNVFFQMKSRDTFAPIGPWIVTADEIADPQRLRVRLSVNGDVMQDFSTDDMAHDIATCIAWVSAIHPLEPGDILATGTNHRGLSPFMDGDTVILETEGLGSLRIAVRDGLTRRWARETRLQRQNHGFDSPTPQTEGKYAK